MPRSIQIHARPSRSPPRRMTTKYPCPLRTGVQGLIPPSRASSLNGSTAPVHRFGTWYGNGSRDQPRNCRCSRWVDYCHQAARPRICIHNNLAKGRSRCSSGNSRQSLTNDLYAETLAPVENGNYPTSISFTRPWNSA